MVGAVSRGVSPKPGGRLAEAQAEDDKCRWFKNAVNEKMQFPKGYVKAAILIIKWAEELDDFAPKHKEEVERLEELFGNRLHYDCSVCELNIKKKPQNQLNSAIAAFVNEHDGPYNLMIIYYTGHGFLSGDERLELTGKREVVNLKPWAPVAYWNEAETPLMQSVDGDVLAILDCCFASDAVKGPTMTRRTYQLIAAAPKGAKTKGPGEQSFTNALIKAMDDILPDEVPITELVQRINKIRVDSTAVHWYQIEGQHQPIILARLDVKERDKQNLEQRPAEGSSITLRFSFEEKDLTQEKIEQFGKQLPEACVNSWLSLRQIDWVSSGLAAGVPRSRWRGAVSVINALNTFRRGSSQSSAKIELDTVQAVFSGSDESALCLSPVETLANGPRTRKRVRSDDSAISPSKRRASDVAMMVDESGETGPPTPLSEQMG